jgi:hypothetical protein
MQTGLLLSTIPALVGALMIERWRRRTVREWRRAELRASRRREAWDAIARVDDADRAA